MRSGASEQVFEAASGAMPMALNPWRSSARPAPLGCRHGRGRHAGRPRLQGGAGHHYFSPALAATSGSMALSALVASDLMTYSTSAASLRAATPAAASA
ncbi:hypothetical protein SBV1_3270001 [Verrucomicrobia bacterium]|nr:hypothetical protein SBV1_3270001 [Verrucomicrobiota bacterium]